VTTLHLSSANETDVLLSFLKEGRTSMPPAMACEMIRGTAMTALRVVLAGVAGRANRASAAEGIVA
jgi:hypothetical protein